MKAKKFGYDVIVYRKVKDGRVYSQITFTTSFVNKHQETLESYGFGYPVLVLGSLGFTFTDEPKSGVFKLNKHNKANEYRLNNKLVVTSILDHFNYLKYKDSITLRFSIDKEFYNGSGRSITLNLKEFVADGKV